MKKINKFLATILALFFMVTIITPIKAEEGVDTQSDAPYIINSYNVYKDASSKDSVVFGDEIVPDGNTYTLEIYKKYFFDLRFYYDDLNAFITIDELVKNYTDTEYFKEAYPNNGLLGLLNKYGQYNLNLMPCKAGTVEVEVAPNIKKTFEIKYPTTDPSKQYFKVKKNGGDYVTPIGDTYYLDNNTEYGFEWCSIEENNTDTPAGINEDNINKTGYFEFFGQGGSDYEDGYRIGGFGWKTIKSGKVSVEVFKGKTVTFVIGAFNDVKSDTPHSEDINWLADNKITTGYSDGTFQPLETVKRCDMAAFIRRLAKLLNVGDAATWTPTDADWNKFSDVNKDTDHAEDILWLAHAGISEGWTVGNTKEFRPYWEISRCDMAAFLRRLAKSIEGSDASTWTPTATDKKVFADVNSETDHLDDVLWLAHAKVSEGWNNNGTKTFQPYSLIARSDMAAFLHRLAA